MKKLFVVALVFGGGLYAAYYWSGANVAEHFLVCMESLQVTKKMQAFAQEEPFKKFREDMRKCMKGGKTSEECLASVRGPYVSEINRFDSQVRHEVAQCVKHKMSLLDSIYFSEEEILRQSKLSFPVAP
jgi:hypothetical protein